MDNLRLEKSKRGRKPTANPKKNRLMIRLNSEEQKQFLLKYERSGMKSHSAFIADCVLNNKPNIVEINKSAIDFVILLSGSFAQARAIINNYSQISKALKNNFGEEKALVLLNVLKKTTIEMINNHQKIIEITTELREHFFEK